MSLVAVSSRVVPGSVALDGLRGSRWVALCWLRGVMLGGTLLVARCPSGSARWCCTGMLFCNTCYGVELCSSVGQDGSDKVPLW
jgi:hypothetical protein